MVILKIIGKLVLIPIRLLIGMIRLVLNSTAKIYCLFTVWFWMFLAVCEVVTAINQRCGLLIILGMMGAVTFGALFGGLMIKAILKELGDCLKKINVSSHSSGRNFDVEQNS